MKGAKKDVNSGAGRGEVGNAAGSSGDSHEKQVEINTKHNAELSSNAEIKLLEIFRYKNGILLGHEFYDYTCERGREVLSMIDGGEFDRETLGVNLEESIKLRLVERRDEVYEPDSDRIHRRGISSLKRPEYRAVQLCENPTLKFLVVFGNEAFKFEANHEMEVRAVADELKKKCGKDVDLYKFGQILKMDAKLEEVEQSMLEAKIRE